MRSSVSVRSLRLSRAAAYVLALLVTVSFAATVSAVRFAEATQAEELQELTATYADLLSAAIPTTLTPLEAISVNRGLDRLADEELGTYVTALYEGADDPPDSVAILRVDQQPPTVVARWGEPPAVLQADPVQPIQQPEEGFTILREIALPDGMALGVVGSVPNSADEVVYAEYRLEIPTGTELPDEAVLYRDGRTSPDHVVLRFASQVPLPEPQLTISVGEGRLPDAGLLLSVHPTSPIVAWYIRYLPWLAAIIGAFATITVTASVELLNRRRVDAEELAAELQASIGQLKEADRATAAAQSRLRGVIQGSPDRLFAITDGRVQFLNADDGDLLNPDTYDLEDALTYVDTADRDRVVLQIERVQRGIDHQWEGVVKGQDADGEPIVSRVRLNPLHHLDDPDGPPESVLATTTDITAAFRAEQERQRLETQLRQAQRLDAIGKLAGGVAHDFNNILGAIIGTAEMLQADLTDETLRGDVDRILAAANRASTLTKQLLTFSRRDVIHPERIDLTGVATDSVDMLSRTLGEGITITVDNADHPLMIDADRGELEQVVVNLAVNARDAMPGGGEVRIHTRCRDGDAELVVSDTGMGIPEELQDHVFEPFFTTKERGRGTGLGLATVYGIVTRWHGEIAITSVPGEGTVVRITWPLSATGGGEDAVVSMEDQRRHEGDGRSILLVEDEDDLREVTQRLLTRAGYEVWTAASGVEALSHPTLERIDLVLSDVVMPGGVSGRDLAVALRQRRPALPVMLMTGYGEDVIDQQQVVTDGWSLLQKPLNEARLLAAVGHVLHSN